MADRYSGTQSSAVSERELKHREISRRAAAEGIVLLENDGVLPLKKGSRVALYGGGARYTIKGGTGSGAVNNRSNVSIDEGLRNVGFVVTSDAWLNEYDARYTAARTAWEEMIRNGAEPGDFISLYRMHATHPLAMPEGAPIEKIEGTDTAIYVISRVSGEGADRKEVKGDYYLSDIEERELTAISQLYPNTVVIINAAGIIDVSFLEKLHISALVLLSQGGMEGGNALGDVLCGDVNPGAKLTDTWAYNYADYPSSATFSHNNGNVIEEKYTDGIYVGYRYFDSFGVKPRYPFGYGLSYTTFAVVPGETTVQPGTVTVSATVTNTGSTAGKEVVQVYVSCPQGKLIKEKKRLVAFAKTKKLAPGASETLKIPFSLSLLESYRTGKASYIMEAGRYDAFIGTTAENIVPVAALTLEKTIFTEQLKPICSLMDALKEIAPEEETALAWKAEMAACNVPVYAIDAMVVPRVMPGEPAHGTYREILDALTVEQKALLCCGRPREGKASFIGSAAVQVPGAAAETTSALKEYGIPAVVLADGPAGIRILQRYEVNPADGSVYSMTRYEALLNRIFGTEFPHEGSESYYQFCSAVPVGMLLAQSFDLELMTEIGELIGCEMEEFGIRLWLAPGMNIHRNPLCGRNYEYYSEDPVLSGLMAAAVTNGVQKTPGLGVTIKHYACNNQEENRMGVSSIVSERALREIYLKGFELAVKTAQPKAIMTSYNKVNGVHAANSYDLCNEAARNEWGFKGIVMTDWTTTNGSGSSAAKCISAGNDLIMPGTMGDIREIVDAINGDNDQMLSMADLDACCARILGFILG